MHKWTLIIAKGNDAPGDSLDSIYWCERCGTVKHDYAHGGGMKSSSYPRYFAPDQSGMDEPECHPVRLVADMEDQPEGFLASAGFAPLSVRSGKADLCELDAVRLELDAALAEAKLERGMSEARQRASYLAGATAYAAQAIHSCLFSENPLLRKVRDGYKPFVLDAGHEAGVKPRVCPMCLTSNLAVKDGMHQCQDCEGLWRHDELAR